MPIWSSDARCRASTAHRHHGHSHGFAARRFAEPGSPRAKILGHRHAPETDIALGGNPIERISSCPTHRRRSGCRWTYLRCRPRPLRALRPLPRSLNGTDVHYNVIVVLSRRIAPAGGYQRHQHSGCHPPDHGNRLPKRMKTRTTESRCWRTSFPSGRSASREAKRWLEFSSSLTC